MEDSEQKPHRKPGRPRKYGKDETEYVVDEFNERVRSNSYKWKERNKEKWLEYQREYQRKYREANKEKFIQVQKDHQQRKREHAKNNPDD